MSSRYWIKGILIVLLFPFSILYGLVVGFIKLMYEIGVYRQFSTPMFSIGVGNITVGGTGKTPHVEFLISNYRTRYKIATLSRGYGRKTKGFLAVNSTLGPNDVGDEPWQFYLKFGKEIKVNVGEKRVEASRKIHELYPEINLLLMDDVFQHHAVKADFSILLCDYTNPFFNDFPFPAGRLREFHSGAKRADVIIVSKCPSDLPFSTKQEFRESLHKFAPEVDVFFSTFVYGQYIPVFQPQTNVPSQWLLVTGIANPKPLKRYLQEHNACLAHLEFADHHEFTEKELELIVSTFKGLTAENKGVLLTEKDYARLNEKAKFLLKELPLFYLPIEVKLLEDEVLFWQKIDLAMKDRDAFQNK